MPAAREALQPGPRSLDRVDVAVPHERDTPVGARIGALRRAGHPGAKQHHGEQRSEASRPPANACPTCASSLPDHGWRCLIMDGCPVIAAPLPRQLSATPRDKTSGIAATAPTRLARVDARGDHLGADPRSLSAGRPSLKVGTINGPTGGVCLQRSGAGADRVADEIDRYMDRCDQQKYLRSLADAHGPYGA